MSGSGSGHLLNDTNARRMHCTSVPQNLALALPGHRTTSDPTVETKDVPPSTANKQAAFRNAPICKAFGACKVVRIFGKVLR